MLPGVRCRHKALASDEEWGEQPYLDLNAFLAVHNASIPSVVLRFSSADIDTN